MPATAFKRIPVTKSLIIGKIHIENTIIIPAVPKAFLNIFAVANIISEDSDKNNYLVKVDLSSTKAVTTAADKFAKEEKK